MSVVRNSLTFGSRANQSVVRLIDILGAANGNASAVTKFILVRNAVLSGPVNFLQTATNSCCYTDSAATGMTTPTRDQKLWSGAIPRDGSIDHLFGDKEITLQPGESVTLAVRGITATAACTGTLNTREEQ